MTDALLRGWPLPALQGEGSKEARGRVLIIAGAVEMPGAAILASNAALRAGAGKVRVATAEAAAIGIASVVPELFVIGWANGRHRRETLRAVIDSARNADSVLIGPGMRDSDAVRDLLPQLLRLETARALIIDASALPIAAEFLPASGKMKERTIITPHLGEMANILDRSAQSVEENRLAIARETAKRFASVVVLKGAETLICAADGAAYLNDRGNVGLATAGSGDVLAGIIAGFATRGADPLQAAAWGVAMHARAGERLAQRVGPVGYLARELVDEIPGLTSRFGSVRA
ncbi:MAG TPA: NAD(P)H-hydrate dehydratase [Chthoniobacterales bacterium]